MTLTTESKQEKNRIKIENRHHPSFFLAKFNCECFSSSLRSTAVQLAGGNTGVPAISPLLMFAIPCPQWNLLFKYQAGKNEVDGGKCCILLCRLNRGSCI